MSSKRAEGIRAYILDNVEKYPQGLGSRVAKKFEITRETASVYLKALVEEGLLEAKGHTRSKQYKLKTLTDFSVTIPISPELEEDVLWRTYVAPKLENIRENVHHICNYGFTEIVNNAIEHSGGSYIKLGLTRNYKSITMSVEDNGIGIFEKIMRDFHLEDRRHAILELSKGKLTSVESRHSGEGIFFTSRMFRDFRIASLDLRFAKTRLDGGDFLSEVDQPSQNMLGTRVMMTIQTDATYTSNDIFSKYTDDDHRFAKTTIPLKLAKYEGEQLVSRSQARRLMMRVDRFSEIMLDFAGIATIGQAFADEIFRVYAAEHPLVNIRAVGTTDEIDAMIAHALANRAEMTSPSKG